MKFMSNAVEEHVEEEAQARKERVARAAGERVEHASKAPSPP